MPRKKWIDKKSATTYALVHRPQNDPRIHDAEASSMVFAELPAPNQRGKTKLDLEEEMDIDPSTVRPNEGEAANHGIYYDDTEYDYMQHLRDIGEDTGAYFVEAPAPQSKQKGKGKQKLEDALRDASLEDDSSDGGVRVAGQKPILDEDLLPSKDLKKGTYQDQQDVPDALAGFQPDMDPRLREVLEALEDDAYVDEEEDIFTELAQDSQEVSQDEFDLEGAVDEMDDGWESDDTAKPDNEYAPPAVSMENGMGESEDHGDGDWMAEFSKFKKATKAKAKAPASKSELQSSLMTSSSVPGGRKKKRKGALTSASGYSMTSSSIFRTEGQTLLDERFDKIEEDYAEDELDDNVSLATSTASQGPIRSDFDSMMDDFLGGYSMSGKKHVKKGGYQTGMEQLEEIRQGLGSARIKPPKTQRA
ncbi:MAG: CDP-diacylglycerol--glycerol-3-phosphate 3-phosphatidyltransferase [Chaenotheca gracillima]|nr:MAG: CDP-diacylglycerol--glycerol-3-phosphate 3-phosphatidyltransferase [Chaenotheca gracillima]